MSGKMQEGIVIAYSEDVAAGVICNGKRRHHFCISEWLADVPPANNMKVSFEALKKGAARQVRIKPDGAGEV